MNKGFFLFLHNQFLCRCWCLSAASPTARIIVVGDVQTTFSLNTNNGVKLLITNYSLLIEKTLTFKF